MRIPLERKEAIIIPLGYSFLSYKFGFKIANYALIMHLSEKVINRLSNWYLFKENNSLQRQIVSLRAEILRKNTENSDLQEQLRIKGGQQLAERTVSDAVLGSFTRQLHKLAADDPEVHNKIRLLARVDELQGTISRLEQENVRLRDENLRLTGAAIANPDDAQP